MKSAPKLCILFLTILLVHCSEKEKVCHISGVVLDPDAKSVILVEPNQDMRKDSIIEIPVVDGKIQYKTHLDYPKPVKLFFGRAKYEGGGRYMPLFLENENIDLTVYPEEDFDKNRVQGGQLNTEYKTFKKTSELKFNNQLKPLQDSLDILFKSNAYHSDEMKTILSKLKNNQNDDERIVLFQQMEDLEEHGLDLSTNAKNLTGKAQKIINKQKAWQQKYMNKNPSVVSYYFLVNDLIYDKENIDIGWARHSYERLSEANPNHPYNTLALNLIRAIENVQIGKKYIDFSAPDLDGNIIKLSDEIKGQIALLDLWGTWCSPCIARSRTMIPVYNAYKDKGFTIVGVAGEFRTISPLKKFLEREKWPWLNLVELDRQNNIWQKYGAGNGGGAIFLIDRQGKIIAKNPTADKVRNELERILNQEKGN